MRKFYLLTLTLLLSITMFAQNRATTLLNETFDGNELPSGWSIGGLGAESWYMSPTNNAGGAANELLLYYYPSFNGISRIVTAPIDLTGIESVIFTFKHCLDNYSGSSKIGIATSSDGINWNTAWEQNYSASGQFVVSEAVATPDMGNPNVLFCMFYEGDSYNINNWYFDDFEIFVQDELDLKLVSIDIPSMTPAGDVNLMFTVQNLGKTTIESFTIQPNGPSIGMCDFFNTETFEATIAPLEKMQFTTEQYFTLQPGQTYNIYADIVDVNGTQDDDLTNNSLEKAVAATMGDAQRIPMIEHFSSSTCGPCVSVNNNMNSLTANNPGKFTYAKYQMNWPGAGDAYYTEEGGVRRDYYGCNAVPMVIIDGESQGAVSQAVLDSYYNKPAFADIRGAFNVEGNTINITADFMSYANVENIRAYVSVNEKVTTGNVGNNGETSFHHVMMKMLDSAEGNIMNINAGEYQRLEFSFDMSTTHVEDMNDLEVALWLQNYETTEVLNSHFAYAYTDHCYPVQNLTAAFDGNSAINVIWEAPEQGTPVGYNIYINNELVEENYTELTYQNTELANELYSAGGDNVIMVVALYEDEKTSVGVGNIFSSGVNVIEKEESTFSIYPNPAKDVVKISSISAQSSVVRIYNVMGMMLDKVEVNSDNLEINISDYTPGVYLFNVEGKTVKVIKN